MSVFERDVVNGRGGSSAPLQVERVFSTEGVHPYDEVAWERRDVVQSNWKTGAVVFEQRGVEFPEFWSLNASTIVTSKYFRGALNTPEREWSLRQVIDRVVSTYVAAGLDNGYFASDRDAQVFSDELTWMLLHQVFSFNSPVWFNVGTSSPQQVSACFILSVDDTMDSILNWYREEGLIFKGGSGAGVNLSRIRSSKEILSSGGQPSGPVSFMRGADASAGTIKSGGATRRAAKMVVLDVDHPDIEEFIDTKVREEDKIRVLRDAGYDMDLGGADITSVQYQNANNSVRVSDLFMESVVNAQPFGLLSRSTGEVVGSVDAEALFRRMCEAAWACADPGLQYDDTINRWHTNPNTGRINASNPCFPASTRVHTDKGLIRFDELVTRSRSGELFKVYTHDATNPDAPAHELQLTSPKAFLTTGVNPIVRLRLSGGQEIRCTPGHRFWTVNRGYVTAEELTPEDRLLPLDLAAPALNASWAIADVAKTAVERNSGESRARMEFPERWSEDLAHYVGWLIGDGSTSSSVATVYGSVEDREEILPRHKAFLEGVNGGRSLKVSEQANGTAQLRLVRGSFRRFLHGLGVSDSKGVEKRVPERVFQAPQPVVAAFLRGLFDADGSVFTYTAKGAHVSLGSVSDGLLRDVQMLLATFGVTSRIYCTSKESVDGYRHERADGSVVRYRRSASYQLRISSRSLDRFATEVGFSLPRKAALLSEAVASRTPYETDVTVSLVERVADGVELTYNLSEPRNHSYVADGVVVRNCSEYMSLDNSSCNLASLNLLKFRSAEDGSFDVARFVSAVELVITAMDISICFADFPTEAIGETTRAFRQLGIGYANLGALLMTSGLPYDSDAGRELAAAITSLMTATAYRRSAELAGIVGPYEGFARNASEHERVMRMHTDASLALAARSQLAAPLVAEANRQWGAGLEVGAVNGWRNAQASVLAPTGTIGFMMDCDTTGIEPDFSLVKFKKLVGGGSLQIVNQAVEPALRSLGYPDEQVEAIVAYVAEHGHVVGAPSLKSEHLAVFDCAMGVRPIEPMGHVRMMAAVQPFLSGAISKTVNLPESATVEDIAEVYLQSWRLGLKAVAVYRDNCKVGQPLSDAKQKSSQSPSESEVASAVPVAVTPPARRRLPQTRAAVTTSFSVGSVEGYFTTGEYEDGSLGELFVKVSKQGSTLSGIMDGLAMAVSVGLQYGVPLETFVAKYVNSRFEPAGMTTDPEVRIAQSVLDFIFRKLALRYLDVDTRQMLGVFSMAERVESLDGYASSAAASAALPDAVPVVGEPTPPREGPADAPAETVRSGPVATVSFTVEAPMCFTCGTNANMRPSGACWACQGCGSTSGCS